MLRASAARSANCVKAAEQLGGRGLHVGVINARFVKPLDREIVERALRECAFVLTVEEGCLMGGFGSAVLEAASEMGLDTSRLKRLGIPDRFIEHGERSELLADLRLNATGIAAACRELAEQGEGVGSLLIIGAISYRRPAQRQKIGRLP